MAICSADHQSIDCGEGHGCAIVCTTEGNHCWASCGSTVVTAIIDRNGNKRKLSEIPDLEFHCSKIQLGSLAEGLARILPYKVTVPRGQKTKRITKRMVGSLDEIVEALGLKRTGK